MTAMTQDELDAHNARVLDMTLELYKAMPGAKMPRKLDGDYLWDELAGSLNDHYRFCYAIATTICASQPAPAKPAEPERQASDRSFNVTRFEVVDERGRFYARQLVNIELSYQDQGRTLKVFVGPR
jgi:hypothetical protein